MTIRIMRSVLPTLAIGTRYSFGSKWFCDPTHTNARFSDSPNDFCTNLEIAYEEILLLLGMSFFSLIINVVSLDTPTADAETKIALVIMIIHPLNEVFQGDS